MLIPSLKLLDVPEVEFETGDTIIKQGTPGAKVYVLLDGKVSIELNNSVITTIEQKGAVFGEISTLLGRAHTASVVAAEPCHFFSIDDLPTFIRQNPDISIQLLKIMAERLVAMNRELAKERESAWWKFWS